MDGCMSLIALKCPHCGGDIQLDDSKEFGFCMHCGTKVMIQEYVKRNVRVDYSDRLANLIEMGRNSIRGGTASDLQDIANKILELDSRNWFGWYLKGVSASKTANCPGMYEAWINAMETISDEDYRQMRYHFVDYAASASIGFGCDSKKNYIPDDFLYAIDDKEPEEVDRFAISVIKTMTESTSLFNEDTSLNAIINAGFLVWAELIVYPDFGAFLGSYEELMKLRDSIVRTKYSFGDNEYGIYSKMFSNELVPYQTLAECLEKSKYSEEEFDAASEYWIENDCTQYLKYFDEASDLAEELDDAGPLSTIGIKRDIKKKMESLIRVYIEHH